MAVPGEGHPSTEVLFVGEAPGLNEDRQGRPFVGAAGQFLDELLGSIGWGRDEVYITNVVKCRPPQNRDPEPDEIAACAPFLRRQLDVLEPTLIVTLGRHSMGRFLPGTRIGQVHGTVHRAPEETPAPGSQVFAMYHPAAALHQGSLKTTLLDDMTRVPGALVDARTERARVEALPLEPEGREPATLDAVPGSPPTGQGMEAGASDPGSTGSTSTMSADPRSDGGSAAGTSVMGDAQDPTATRPTGDDDDQMPMFR